MFWQKQKINILKNLIDNQWLIDRKKSHLNGFVNIVRWSWNLGQQARQACINNSKEIQKLFVSYFPHHYVPLLLFFFKLQHFWTPAFPSTQGPSSSSPQLLESPAVTSEVFRLRYTRKEKFFWNSSVFPVCYVAYTENSPQMVRQTCLAFTCSLFAF